MTRHVIAALPDGEYQCEDYMDDDGITAVPVKIRVTVRVHGQDVEVDFTGSDPQVRGSVNANFAITNVSRVLLYSHLAQEQFPFNYGCMAPVKIIAAAGGVVNCTFPSAVAGAMSRLHSASSTWSWAPCITPCLSASQRPAVHRRRWSMNTCDASPRRLCQPPAGGTAGRWDALRHGVMQGAQDHVDDAL